MLIQTRALVVSQQGRALGQPLTFSLEKGQLSWIRGENGVGKSTVLKTLLGLMPPLSGEIIWSSPKPTVFYLSHNLGLPAGLSVYEHCYWHPATQRPSEAGIRSALSRLELSGDAMRPCQELSRGQKQRLALAVAILSEAELWLLDEPFTALDPSSVALVKGLLKAHCEAGGAAIVVSHHAMENLADDTVHMQEAVA